VQGPRGRSIHASETAVLALRLLAVVPVGQLAAAGAAQLQALRQPVLLVPQPQKHRL
jgi:hypothetical protein